MSHSESRKEWLLLCILHHDTLGGLLYESNILRQMANKITHQFHSVHIVNHLFQDERKGRVDIAGIFKEKLPILFCINNLFLSRRRKRTIFHCPCILKSAPLRMLSGVLLLCFILQSGFLSRVIVVL